MYGQDILCVISKVSFEIPHKISYAYIERCAFYLRLSPNERHICVLPRRASNTNRIHVHKYIVET